MTDLRTRFDRARQVTAPDLWEDVHRRTARLDGPLDSPDLDPPVSASRGQRVLAVAVAFGVSVLGGAFAWNAFGGGPGASIGADHDLPSFEVMFTSAGPVAHGGEDARSVGVDLAYGDLTGRTEIVATHSSWTDAIVPDGDLAPFATELVAGSRVRLDADGEDARVLIGMPEDWADIDRFERIEHLPVEPGSYVIVFEADYPEGTARLAMRVELAAPADPDPGPELAAPETPAAPTREPSPAVDASERSDPSNIPNVLRVACTAQATELGSSRVRPQPDGVHVAIENPEGIDGNFHATLLGRQEGRFDTFTKGLDPGTNRIVFEFPPGEIFVSCFMGNHFDADGVTREDLSMLEVVDPEGLYVSNRLACEVATEMNGFRDDAGALSPFESSPEAAVRTHVPGILGTDEVVRAIYPASGDRPGDGRTAYVVVRRDGDAVAWMQVSGSIDRWGVHFGYACPGSGLGGT